MGIWIKTVTITSLAGPLIQLNIMIRPLMMIGAAIPLIITAGTSI